MRTGVTSRFPTYPTIPHTAVVPPLALSAVDNAPKLALGQFRGPEPAGAQLGREARPYLVVFPVQRAHLAVPPADEVLDALGEVRGDVRDDPARGRLGQPGGGRHVAHELERELVAHGPMMPHQGRK